MVGVGMHHIAEGTEHRLFLLTLLLPAPLRAVAGRWRGAVSTKTALRRILAITLAFTLGHSVTLAAGSLGLPVPIGTVEALIAMSILIAAAHAVRPLSPPSPRSAGLLDRVGVSTPLAVLADGLSVLSIPVVIGLWMAALTLRRRRTGPDRSGAGGSPSGTPSVGCAEGG